MNPNPPIPGHELLNEGQSRRWHNRSGVEYWHGGCRCGEKPDGFPDVSVYAMKRWHRQHKAQIRETQANEDERQAAQWPL